MLAVDDTMALAVAIAFRARVAFVTTDTSLFINEIVRAIVTGCVRASNPARDRVLPSNTRRSARAIGATISASAEAVADTAKAPAFVFTTIVSTWAFQWTNAV